MFIEFALKGQLPSGKNAVTITRTGHRFPKASFVKWRTESIRQIGEWNEKPIDYPVNVLINYYAGDRRRRDVPGMIDALWHLVERAGIVTDDRYLGGTHKVTSFFQHYDKENPRVIVRIEVKDARIAQKLSRGTRSKLRRTPSNTIIRSRKKALV